MPGATVVGVARRHGVNSSQLYNWRRAFGSPEGLALPLSGFVPVVVDGAPAVSIPASGPVIEIVVGAVTIRVDAAVDAGVLHRVMEAARWLA